MYSNPSKAMFYQLKSMSYQLNNNNWAFVMPMPGKDVTEEELRELCRSKLANFKVPKKFIIRPLLPLLASGKVSKLA
jgi:acyl-CoA synthetase (AMP-forming)/AMP-acid ligase II